MFFIDVSVISFLLLVILWKNFFFFFLFLFLIYPLSGLELISSRFLSKINFVVVSEETMSFDLVVSRLNLRGFNSPLTKDPYTSGQGTSDEVFPSYSSRLFKTFCLLTRYETRLLIL